MPLGRWCTAFWLPGTLRARLHYGLGPAPWYRSDPRKRPVRSGMHDSRNRHDRRESLQVGDREGRGERKGQCAASPLHLVPADDPKVTEASLVPEGPHYGPDHDRGWDRQRDAVGDREAVRASHSAPFQERATGRRQRDADAVGSGPARRIVSYSVSFPPPVITTRIPERGLN